MRKKGFTLVEVIVVLVILAILAAILIPSMIGWIEKANQKTVVAEARGVYLAAKGAVVEAYALYDDYKTGANKWKDTSGSACGRITDNMLYAVQNNKVATQHVGSADAYIAGEVLDFLDSRSKASAQYTFSSAYNPQGLSVTGYQTTYKQPGVIIAYTPAGEVLFIEYGRDDVLVHIDGATAAVTVTTDGAVYNGYPR